MKTKYILSLLILMLSLTGFSKVWTINNSGTSYSPSSISIFYGDTVKFEISGGHDANEVSQTTWNADGNTHLSGGFQTEFGGGTVLPEQLGVGTHYYVCTPHASLGMKGTIIVENPTGIAEPQLPAVSVFPNPSDGQFTFSIDGTNVAENYKIEVYTLTGDKIYQTTLTNSISEIELSNQKSGMYILKIFNGEAILTKKIEIQ